MITCFTCRDQGLEGGCPKCGKTPVKIEVPVSLEKMMGIPTKKPHKWDSKILLNSHKDKIDDMSFKRYVKVLDFMYSEAVKGTLFKQSLMIISDRGCGKHNFIYSMMSALSANGLSVCQLFDHSEYLRLCTLGTERPFDKQRINIDDIIYSDFCAMSIDPCNRYSSIKAIQSILSKRGHAGNPTIIISDYPLSNLVTERTKDIEIRYSDGMDELRYCKILRA